MSFIRNAVNLFQLLKLVEAHLELVSVQTPRAIDIISVEGHGDDDVIVGNLTRAIRIDRLKMVVYVVEES